MGKGSRGFTLIEVTLVVGIIGVLSSVAIPKFNKFQSRARQAEAKSNLKGLFSTKKANFAEKDTYRCGMCGFVPEKGNRYTYRAGDVTIESTVGGVNVDVPSTKVVAAADGVLDFTVTASGNIDTDAFIDEWSMGTQQALCNGKDSGGICDMTASDVLFQ